MDLRSLRYFVSAVECGTISGAAQQCHIAQPSISSAIGQLEAEFDLQLFIRSKKGVSLTLVGEDFYLKVKTLLQSAQQFEQDFKTPERQKISVFASPQLASADISRMLKHIADVLPDCIFQINEDKAAAELILASGSAKVSDSQFTPLIHQEYRLLAPQSWAMDKQISLEKLLTYPLIDRLDCEKRAQFLAGFPQLQNMARYRVSQEDLALSLVQQQLGITFMAVNPGDKKALAEIQSCSLKHLAPESLLTRQLGVFVHNGLEQKTQTIIREAGLL